MSTPPAGAASARSMTARRREYRGIMTAIWPSQCVACPDGWIAEGQWQALADAPPHGRRWVHEACARRLRPDTPPRPETPTPAATPGAGPLRILVVGSPEWPKARAVEVRDAIAAVARGHATVTLIHHTRTDPISGRLRGVDAWAALTATRLHLATEQLPPAAGAGELPAPRPTVVIAFPLHDDHATTAAVTAAETAGLPVLAHRL